jgi:hypothetical protein
MCAPGPTRYAWSADGRRRRGGRRWTGLIGCLSGIRSFGPCRFTADRRGVRRGSASAALGHAALGHATLCHGEARLAHGEPLVPGHTGLVDAAERRVGIVVVDDVLALVEPEAAAARVEPRQRPDGRRGTVGRPLSMVDPRRLVRVGSSTTSVFIGLLIAAAAGTAVWFHADRHRVPHPSLWASFVFLLLIVGLPAYALRVRSLRRRRG